MGADKATLAFMVGCAPDAPFFPTIEGVLSMMGKNVKPCGAPSLGLGAKLSNNYLSGLLAIATSEAMNLGMRIGLDRYVLSDVFKVSTGSNYTNNHANPVPGICPDAPGSHNYEPGFRAELMLKDFTLAVKAARDVKAKLVLGDAGLETYRAVAEEFQGRDSRIVYKYLGGQE